MSKTITNDTAARTDLNIRNVVKDDLDRLKSIIDSSELFPSEMLDDMVGGFLVGKEECIWLTADGSSDDGNMPSFVAYCAPEKMTEGTWYLLLIAVHPNSQRTGVGSKVIRYLEQWLVQKKNARVLLVETSSLPEFENTRNFYLKNKFVEEARIRDYYTAGEDKIVFWKSLT